MFCTFYNPTHDEDLRQIFQEFVDSQDYVTLWVENDPILRDFSLILFKKIINNKFVANNTNYTEYRIYYIHIRVFMD